MLDKDCKVKLQADLKLNLKIKEASAEIQRAAELTMRDVTVKVAHDVVEGSPYLTGNNRRSIQYEIDGLESSIFSTSGYGGFLETGTWKMAPRPYFKPAADRNFTLEKFATGMKERLG